MMHVVTFLFMMNSYVIVNVIWKCSFIRLLGSEQNCITGRNLPLQQSGTKHHICPVSGVMNNSELLGHWQWWLRFTEASVFLLKSKRLFCLCSSSWPTSSSRCTVRLWPTVHTCFRSGAKRWACVWVLSAVCRFSSGPLWLSVKSLALSKM